MFVDREEPLKWMTNALTRCQAQSVVLHIRGIGGIGKTALLDHWHHSIETSIMLDCELITNFFDRLDAISKSAVRLGIRLRRFDLLWSIRLRFIQGIEPAKEPGRDWVFDVISPLPFIGSLVNIGKAIHTIGGKLSPRIKRRFGDVADWLQTRLGKDSTEKLLEILWKNPRQAEILFLDALLEDLNSRKNTQPSLLLLLDHYEEVESEQLKWGYDGRRISEAELWYEFLASINNSISVMASRKAPPKHLSSRVNVEDIELTELDATSCRDLLVQHKVEDQELQTQIISVSGGNPFVLKTICDLKEFNQLSLKSIENLRADTLEEVRLKTWRRLFDHAEDLLEIIDRAGILPFFNRPIMSVIAPQMKTDHWDRLIHLSFVQNRGDGSWKLHDLARDLVLAELGDKLDKLVLDVSHRLKQAAQEQADPTLQGMALSVQALVDEPKAIEKAGDIVNDLNWSYRFKDALSMLAFIRFNSEEGKMMVKWHRGRILQNLNRFTEGEQDHQEVLPYFRKQASINPDKYTLFVAWALTGLAINYRYTGRFSRAEETFQEAIQLFQELTLRGERPMFGVPDINLERLIWTRWHFGLFLFFIGHFTKAEEEFKETLKLSQKFSDLKAHHKDIDKQFSMHRKLIDEYYCRITVSLARLYIFSERPIEAEELIRKAYQVAITHKEEKDFLWMSFYVPLIVRDFSYILIRTGRLHEAESLIREIIEDSRAIEEENPEIPKQLGFILNIQAIFLSHIGNLTKAEECFQEALEILSEEQKREPIYDPWIAMVLNNLGVLHRRNSHFKKAERVHTKALKINRHLADQVSEHSLPLVAISLTNLAVLLGQTDRLAEAEETLREALTIRRTLTEQEPKHFRQHLATSLNNLGVVLAASKNLTEAETALTEALQLRRDLSEQAPSLYLPDLASTLSNLGVLFKITGRFLQAEQVYLEAMNIFEELTAKIPEKFQVLLVKLLTNLALLYSKLKTPKVSLKTIQTRLQELNTTKLSEVEEWFEDEEISYIF
ncbi:MAG: tetratricopeptide repeat protein [Promethearchaeota archaeon]